MQQRGAVLDVVCYSAAISSCEKGLPCARALKLLVTMERRGVVPNVLSNSAAISSCEKRLQWEEAPKLVAVISSCEKGLQLEETLKLLGLWSSGAWSQPLSGTTLRLVSAMKGLQWAKALTWETSQKLLVATEQWGVIPDVGPYNAASSTCSKRLH